MSYKLLRKPLFRLLKYPMEPPPWPPGTTEGGMRFRAAPGYLYQQLIVWGGGFGVTLLIEFLVLANVTFNILGYDIDLSEVNFSYLPVNIAIVFTLAAAIGKYFLIRIEYDLLYYIVTDRNVRIRRGQLSVHEATYTIANIQNLRIQRGPIEKLFGISRLIFETAGGGLMSEIKDSEKIPGHCGVLKGITNPQELRDHIQERVRWFRDSGLGDPDDKYLPQPAADRAGFPAGTPTVLKEIRDELRAIKSAVQA